MVTTIDLDELTYKSRRQNLISDPPSGIKKAKIHDSGRHDTCLTIQVITESHGSRWLRLSHEHIAELLSKGDLGEIRTQMRYSDNGEGQCPHCE